MLSASSTMRALPPLFTPETPPERDLSNVPPDSVYDKATNTWLHTDRTGHTYEVHPNPKKLPVAYYRIDDDGRIIGYDRQDVAWSIDDRPVFYREGFPYIDPTRTIELDLTGRITLFSAPSAPVRMSMIEYIDLRVHQLSALRYVYNNLKVPGRNLRETPWRTADYEPPRKLELVKATLSALLDFMNSHIDKCRSRYRDPYNSETHITTPQLYTEIAMINKTIEYINLVARNHGYGFVIWESEYSDVFRDGKMYENIPNFEEIIIDHTIPPSHISTTKLSPKITSPREDYPTYFDRDTSPTYAHHALPSQKNITKLFKKHGSTYFPTDETSDRPGFTEEELKEAAAALDPQFAVDLRESLDKQLEDRRVSGLY